MTKEEQDFIEAMNELSRKIAYMMEKTQEVFLVAERSKTLLEDTLADIKNWKPDRGMIING